MAQFDSGDVYSEFQTNLPEAPKNYSWESLAAINGSILIPDKWYFTPRSVEGIQTYFVTPEPFEDGGEFDIGLTLSALEYTKEKTGKTPNEYAKRFIRFRKINYLSYDEREVNRGKFRQYDILFETVSDEKPKLNIRTRLLANDRTDKLYIVLFEAPKAQWDKIWKVARPSLEKLILDDGF